MSSFAISRSATVHARPARAGARPDQGPARMGALVSVAGRRPGESTEVTWAMSGQQNLFAKLMFTVMKMEQVIGKDFERGLARLTTAAETA